MKNLILFLVVFCSTTHLIAQSKLSKETYYDDWPVEVESNEKSTKEKVDNPQRFVTIGTTWDHRIISYFFSNGTPDIAGTDEEQAIRDAFAIWEAVTDLVFIESCVEADADIVILYGSFNHGDAGPFDGTGGVLAHTLCGPPPQPVCGDDAGDIHFDESETWTLNTRPNNTQPIDLVTVAAHEIGHSLGLDHTTVSGSLMLANYSGSHRFLGSDDIAGIRNLYGNSGISNRLIDGSPLLCTTNIEYELLEVPTDMTVEWSVSPTNLFAVDVGNGATFQTRATNSSSMGNGTITATVVNGACDEITIDYDLYIGRPNYNNLILSVDNDELSNCDYTYADADYSGISMGISAYEWNIPYSSDWYIDEEYGSPADWQYVEIDYYDEYPPLQEAIHIRAQNTCGWSLWREFWVDADDCAGSYYAFTLSPNPVEEVLTVSFTSNETAVSAENTQLTQTEKTNTSGVPVEVSIFDKSKYQILYKKGNTDNNMELDVSAIPAGSYFIHVAIEGEKTQKKHLIIE